MIDLKTITRDEEIIFKLRSLYEKYGYNQFKMNKFEEYELYVRNKDFLVSSNIISFTDLNGKLMALKPDVTLSIIKNGVDKENNLQKVYYNENVYRVPKKGDSFKEIMQVGLECIGDIDDYSILEVVLLAIKSLESISNDFVLDISHLGIIKEIMDNLNLSQSDRQIIIKCISEKNTHDLSKIENAEFFIKLISTYGNLDKTAKILKEIYPKGLSNSAKQLIDLVEVLEKNGYKDKIRIDFSVLSDMNYYSGIVFNGFVNGISTSILSGGQYDLLMEKMGRKSKGLGFAVYLNMLEKFDDTTNEYDIDTLIIYNDKTNIEILNDLSNNIVSKGKSVLVKKRIPEKLKYKELLKVDEEK